ncbi:MAG: hypothetical protein HeimC3_23500 [Candidatus Heimdallarchaeota archaeon LC_3]|nr:MAG: hypothetical protein HeimC3_23500 [Candidatus Heimdallarchaeota archaeon LC_3]
MRNKNGFFDKARESLEASSARSFYIIVFFAILKNFWGGLRIEIDLVWISSFFILVFIFSLFLRLIESKKDVSDIDFTQNQ